ncbi:HpcH/HpaI aldolase/citrate lyase family protein [Sphingobium sp.]|uniref:HpcH/HpaI aldolase/citrate lyase family protein n=1 Tax=Sphingobium sp. TaxID=1912891 RepID=UPI003B3B76F1
MTDIQPRRSALYLPAINERAIAKARTMTCDAVILDLEDSVAPDQKAQARDNAVCALAEGGFAAREVVIRVNGHDTPWHQADVTAVRSARPDALLLPKVSAPDDVLRCAAMLDGDMPIWAMIETARSLFHLDAIAATARTGRLACLVIGTNDLVKELRATPAPDRAIIIPFLMSALAAARAHDLSILDGVFNTLDDEADFIAECRQGAAMGFDGKTLIHPRQIDACHDAYSPGPDDIAWARTVIAAFDQDDNRQKGVIRIDGKMVERLHLAQARQVMALADATFPP